MKGQKGWPRGPMSEERKRKISEARTKRTHFNCDNCGKPWSDKPSHFTRYKYHFCSNQCYREHTKSKRPFNEQNAYKGVRKSEESKQVYHRNYCKNNPDNIRHLKARRYAREKGADGSHTFGEWDILKQKYGGRCAICKELKKLTKDHIVPLSKGGSDYIGNIQPLCKNCNSRKNNKTDYQHPNLLNN